MAAWAPLGRRRIRPKTTHAKETPSSSRTSPARAVALFPSLVDDFLTHPSAFPANLLQKIRTIHGPGGGVDHVIGRKVPGSEFAGWIRKADWPTIPALDAVLHSLITDEQLARVRFLDPLTVHGVLRQVPGENWRKMMQAAT
jgi:hypothetical protein